MRLLGSGAGGKDAYRQGHRKMAGSQRSGCKARNRDGGRRWGSEDRRPRRALGRAKRERRSVKDGRRVWGPISKIVWKDTKQNRAGLSPTRTASP
jgi:hypothetical protein